MVHVLVLAHTYGNFRSRASGVEITPAMAACRRGGGASSPPHRMPPPDRRPRQAPAPRHRLGCERPRNLHHMRRHYRCIRCIRRIAAAAAFWSPPPSPPSPPPPPPPSSPRLRSAQVCMHNNRARSSHATLAACGSEAQPACPSLQKTCQHVPPAAAPFLFIWSTLSLALIESRTRATWCTHSGVPC